MVTDNITDKKILFLCTSFYSYYDKIKAELLKIGAAEVTFVEAPFFKESFRYSSANIRTIVFWLANPHSRTKWTKNILMKKCEDKHFDVLFCVGDVPFKYFFIDWIKDKNPKIKLFLFLWDKLSVVKIPICLIKAFDYKYSFDRDDCASTGHMKYLPDFYIDDINDGKYPLKYDVSFIGTFTKIKRAYVLHELKKYCDLNNLSYFLYLYSGGENQTSNVIKSTYRCIKEKRKKYLLSKYESDGFIFKEKLPLVEVEKILAQSRCILDMSYSGRQGLTLNAVYAIAKSKKLITANQRIINESFYRNQNILVFKSNKPQFDISFFHSNTEPVDISYLRLDNWLKLIINTQ